MVSVTALALALTVEGAVCLLLLSIVLLSLDKKLQQLQSRADAQLMAKWVDAMSGEQRELLDRIMAQDLAEFRHLRTGKTPRVAKPMRELWDDDRPFMRATDVE